MKFILDDFEFGLQRLLDGIEAYVKADGKGASATLTPVADRRRRFVTDPQRTLNCAGPDIRVGRL